MFLVNLEGSVFRISSGASTPNMVGPPTILDIVTILNFCSFRGFLILLESCLFMALNISSSTFSHLEQRQSSPFILLLVKMFFCFSSYLTKGVTRCILILIRILTCLEFLLSSKEDNISLHILFRH